VIAALLIGREGSIGFPGKNVYPVLGRPLMEYPLLAAKGSRHVDAIYVSTDSPRIKQISKGYGARIIDRPPELCTAGALGEDVFVHGYHEIRAGLGDRDEVELLVLLMCNAPTITAKLVDEGIVALREHPEYDSAVTVSRYNMYSPLRARRIGEDGLLHPFVPFEAFGDPRTLNCDRDSQGDVWFADMGASVIRPRNLGHLEEGLLPQKWMGQKIYPLKQWGGLDIDYEWQIPQAGYWLSKHGYGEEN
jgi:molybdopterin-guanine dinucleotide biosynthesis protein A